MRYAGWPDEVTPRDLARALGVSDRIVRHWLRENFSEGHARYERWIFTPREADELVAAYRRRA